MIAALAALAGYGALLAAAFGVRTLLHRRTTGTSGWLRPPTRAARAGDGLFTVGVAATLAAPVLQLTDTLDPLAALDFVVVHIAGAGLLAVGSALALVAQAQMGPAWRAGIDRAARDPLVQTGLFHLVRNPFYLGIIAATVGVAGLTPNAAALAGTVALVAGCQIDVRLVEEPNLRAAHGARYESYAASTPRFVPNPFRRPAR
ncbi:MAG: methyltransferase family protein [Acidimicrobiales bacterium]